ncbi:hypothetical protein BDV29DRAFT_185889 [Aspergillus leporis]|uniref:DRBM domain-containing protein n=1 Tax=Aspergillus leporis TaxID=41062 RepID=A0A5N5WGV3_9EURO|nr:hypothetical protein BDV29DRAFT_185889 [Aspergillus leporis]
MSVPNVSSANNGNGRISWQDQLKSLCWGRKFSEPTFKIFTERRGGRTAWTCVVSVQGVQYPAQFWYDGNYINNAREDAAEKALNVLNGSQKSQAPRYPSLPGHISDPLFPQTSTYVRR